MHVSLAEATVPIKWEGAGWAPPAPQLPGLKMTFDYPAEEFIQKVMSQHCTISYGDNRQLLNDLALLLSIKVI